MVAVVLAGTGMLFGGQPPIEFEPALNGGFLARSSGLGIVIDRSARSGRTPCAALCLHFAWYNFVRVHKSLRMTPAMAAGLTDHIWTIRELLEAA